MGATKKDFIEAIKGLALPLFRAKSGSKYVSVASKADRHLLLRLDSDPMLGKSATNGETQPGAGLTLRFACTFNDPECPKGWEAREAPAVGFGLGKSDYFKDGDDEKYPATYMNKIGVPLLSALHGPRDFYEAATDSAVAKMIDSAIKSFAKANGLKATADIQMLLETTFGHLNEPTMKMSPPQFMTGSEFAEFQRSLAVEWQKKMNGQITEAQKAAGMKPDNDELADDEPEED